MHLTGDVEVVSGRYMQDFDLADRFLSARRVMEEDKPFWDGDPFCPDEAGSERAHPWHLPRL
jgi:hypothetical protein